MGFIGSLLREILLYRFESVIDVNVMLESKDYEL